MIEIKVKTEAWEHQVNECEFSCTISDESTSTQAIEMFVKALILDGYGDEGVRAGLEDAEYELYESINSSYKIMSERREV